MGVTNRIGFFLHIPWPAHQLVVTLPRHRPLVEAMFDYDLIGFQTEESRHAFEGYVTSEVGGSVASNGELTAFGKTTRAAAFPIGIDAEDFARITQSPRARKVYDRMLAHSVFRKMVVGVDRLDYSKGLEERLIGFERFLHDNPDMRREVMLLQIAPLSRDEVEAYQDLRSRLDGLIGRINGAYAEMDFTPIRYVNKSYRRDELAGIYRAAKVGLVTPLRDGMNLVAKEYVAAQDPEDPGVLILSRFAGAARQMGEALIVNPNSPEEISDALSRALAMGLPERKRRWEALFDNVQRKDVTAWRDDFVGALTASSQEIQPVPPPRSLQEASTEAQAEMEASPALSLQQIRADDGPRSTTPEARRCG
jgi:trehalose 6-phosphate synthase